VFQTAGVWEIGRHARFALPAHVDRVVLRGVPTPMSGRLDAVVVPTDSAFDGTVVDEAGHVVIEVHGYRTVELPGGVNPDERHPLAEAMA
jgi:hypothetical protein